MLNASILLIEPICNTPTRARCLVRVGKKCFDLLVVVRTTRTSSTHTMFTCVTWESDRSHLTWSEACVESYSGWCLCNILSFSNYSARPVFLAPIYCFVEQISGVSPCISKFLTSSWCVRLLTALCAFVTIHSYHLQRWR